MRQPDSRRQPEFRFQAIAALCAALAFPFGIAHAQANLSATVIFASAGADIVSASGDRRPAAAGLSLTSGDTIDTGKGRVQLKMVDGALMSLQPDTRLRLDDYHLATNGGSNEKGYMSLLKGGLRTVSGVIGKARPDNYRLDTPAGTIGIRGTEYTAVLRDGLTVGVIGGRVAVCNDTGCNDVARGMSAFAASRADRPVLSKLVSTVVPATTTAAVATTAATVSTENQRDSAVVTAQTTTAISATVPVVHTSGEDVRGYLQSLLTPVAQPETETGAGAGASVGSGAGTGSQGTSTSAVKAPGSFSVPAGIVTPPPAPSPGSGVDTGAATPAPPLTPITPTTPGTPIAPAPLPLPAFVESPLPSSIGDVIAVSSDQDGKTALLVQSGYRTFTGTALTEVREREGSGKKLLEKGTAVQTHSDGSIAWGRWIEGKHRNSSDSETADDSNGNGKTVALHYFSFAGTPTLPVLRSFNSFGSTATTITSASGQLLATGSENGASGTLRITFPTIIGGLATYNLTVPVSGQTFSLAGTGLQTGSFGFAGSALITSTGTACLSVCTGALGGGNAVRGMVGGAGSSRAGLVYGFTSGLGQISGAMVFKP